MGVTVFPLCFLTWGHSVVEVMKASFKRPYGCTDTLRAPTLRQATADHAPPQTPSQLPVSLGQSLVGVTAPFSWVLVHKVLFVPSKSQFPQSCVSSGGSVVGLMEIASKRAYAIPRSTAPRALLLRQSTADPYLHRRHSDTVLAQSLWGLWVLVWTRFVWAIWA